MVKNLELSLNKYRFDTIISKKEDIKNINLISDKILIDDLPDSFKGQEVWKKYLNPITEQGICGSCWAWSSSNCLSNRMRLKSLNRINIILSPIYLLLCDVCENDENCAYLLGSEFNLESINKIYSEGILNKGCTGNTLENTWGFLYNYGTVKVKCINYEITKIDDEKLLPLCSEISGLKLDMCGDYIYNKNTKQEEGKPARFFRSIASYQVPGIKEQGGSDQNIMSDIFINGPVTAGYIIYPDFYESEWVGEIYEAKPDQEPLGGHAINIIGWGEKNGTKFWWIENTWGKDWGEDGYFRMIRGVNNCGIEESVICGIPDLFYPNMFDFTKTYIKDYSTMDNSLKLKRLDIDYGNLKYGFSGFDTRTGFTRRVLQSYSGFNFKPLISVIEIQLILDTNKNIGDIKEEFNDNEIIENFEYSSNISLKPEYIMLIIFYFTILLIIIRLCYLSTNHTGLIKN